MLIIPAIDLKEGKCVRLRQGRMDDATVFSENPVATARHWMESGGRRLHLVDLDGAFEGKPVNAEVVKRIVDALPNTPIQIGGGIRRMETIDSYLAAGVQWVIIGTQAVKKPGFVLEACKKYPGHILVGIDATGGRVATEGWADVSSVSALDLARQFADSGVSGIIYTDIERDGMMQGVNAEATAELAAGCGLPVIASGGITDMRDIDRLLAVADKGIAGAITGRAIYEGSLDLGRAQRHCDQATGSGAS